MHRYFFSLRNKIIATRNLPLDSKSLQSINDNLIVHTTVVKFVILGIGREEAEAGISEIMVDCSSAGLAPWQIDSILFHLLHLALFPGVLMFTYYYCGTVLPQEQGGWLDFSLLENVLLDCQIEVNLIPWCIQDLHAWAIAELPWENFGQMHKMDKI